MANGLHKLTVQESQNAQLGQAGYKYIDQAGTGNTGTASDGVEYVAVTIIESASDVATIATEANDTVNFPNTTFVGIAAGTTIYGRWNKITITGTNATAICYRG